MVDVTALLNNSRVMVAVTSVLFNLGAKYIVSDLTPMQERILQHVLFKRALVFCMFFVVSRDVIISLMLTFAFFVVLKGLVHEESPLCLVPGVQKCRWAGHKHNALGLVIAETSSRMMRPPARAPPRSAEES